MRRHLYLAVATLSFPLLSTLPAAAQKIAPSRQYGTEVYSGPSDAAPRTYPAPRASTDQNFGVPNFGDPAANMPQQRATVAPKPRMEEIAPGIQQATPMPAPQMAAPEEDADPVAEAFDRGGDDKLPSQAARGSDGLDTPLFTTPADPAGQWRSNRGATTARVSRPDPLFTTGAATTSTDQSTLNDARVPGESTTLDSNREPNPLAVDR
ncbi:MAG: hypothetical protein ACJ8AW_04960 [Rhodopila sp.]